jgi:hypothetical protein
MHKVATTKKAKIRLDFFQSYRGVERNPEAEMLIKGLLSPAHS